MRKFLGIFAAFGLLGTLVNVPLAQAEVSVTAAPAALVTDPILVKGSSSPIPLFSVSLNSTQGETVSGIAVQVNANATTTVAGADLANVAVYKDDGSGTFAMTDTLVGQQTAVNLGSSTVVNLATSTAASGKFFVTLSTGSSWSDVAPADSIKVTLPSNAITTTATTTPTTTPVTTGSISADTTAPQLVSVVARNTGGTDAKEAGDSIELNFSEPTNKPDISSTTINTFFSVNNSHSFLDASSSLASAVWDVAGKKLTVSLSGATSSTTTLASIAVGDVVTVNANSGFTDLAGNLAAGTQAVTGSFAGAITSGGDDEENVKGSCANSLINGRLYKVGNSPTVYLAAACRLKPFRGQAVFKARGQKFGDNIIVLSSMPANVSVSENPVLPTAGTLVKGSDKTVWFVTKDGKRRGFVSSRKFQDLGFAFDKVEQISDSDLSLIPASSPIEENESHPDGSLIKCSASPAIYQVIGKDKFPFANADSFKGKGHTFEQVLVVDCSKYQYPTGAAVTQ